MMTLLAVTCLLVLAVCGDDDKKGVEPEVQAAGRFLDSPVEGLSYESGSLSGVTTADGGFKYIAGSAVRFSLGSIVLGEGNGKSIMTPVDLVSGARDENNQTVTNICRFLLTLDDDADPDGGVTITNDVRTAASGKSVNFNQTPEAFGSDPNVTTTVAELTAITLAGQRDLVAANDAQAHLRGTLLGIFSGAYSGRYDGGDTGSWTITVDSEGTLSGVVHADDGDVYTVWGDVRSSGDANFAEGGVSVCGGVFSGTITTDGSISGTWICELDPDYSGTFSGRKDDDTTPPSAVQDLRVGAVTASSVTLRWTSPGDDGDDGTAAGYDVRYSTSSGASWDEMTQATGEPLPRPEGATESFTVTGLTPGTTYYFRLRTADEVPNWSDVSNSVSGATTGGVPLPGSMVLVPAGTFTMGDGDSASFCGTNERQVTLTHAYYLGQYEVTNQEYRDALQWAYDNGYVTVSVSTIDDNVDGSTAMLVHYRNYESCQISFTEGTFVVDPGKESHPMVELSWYGAAAYCDWLSMREGIARAYDHSTWLCNGGSPYTAAGYRLPTDAEWEYAAQYDDERIYPWGNEQPDCSRVNYWGCVPGDFPRTAAVGSYPAAPAALGLYDMAGNLDELCNDWFICDLGTSSETDPTGPGSGSDRVVRGGSWRSGSIHDLRVSDRSRFDPMVLGFAGFRVARTAN